MVQCFRQPKQQSETFNLHKNVKQLKFHLNINFLDIKFCDVTSEEGKLQTRVPQKTTVGDQKI